jgi:hypothetical protein
LEIEDELAKMLAGDCFAPYIQVFSDFHFGDRLTPILISQIYPFEGYLGEDGKPEVRSPMSARAAKMLFKQLVKM